MLSDVSGLSICQLPIPTWIGFFAGTFAYSVSQEHGMICLRSSRFFS